MTIRLSNESTHVDTTASGCYNHKGRLKKKWATAKAALFVAGLAEIRYGCKQVIYFCGDCHYYHVAKKNRR